MLKKLMLLGAAIAALVAIAAPAAQAEYEWETNGVPITKDGTVTLHGDTRFHLTSGLAGYDVTVTATLIAYDGTHQIGDVVATVEELHVADCIGTVGLSGPTCTPSTTTQDWDIYLRAGNTLEIDVNLHLLYWAGPHTGTPVATMLLIGGVFAELGEGGAVETAQLSGEGIYANGSPGTVEGELEYTGGEELAIT